MSPEATVDQFRDLRSRMSAILAEITIFGPYGTDLAGPFGPEIASLWQFLLPVTPYQPNFYHSLAVARLSLDFCRNFSAKIFSTESLQSLSKLRDCVSKLDVTNIYFSRVFPIYFPWNFDHKSRDHMIALYHWTSGDRVKFLRKSKGPDGFNFKMIHSEKLPLRFSFLSITDRQKFSTKDCVRKFSLKFSSITSRKVAIFLT